MNKLDFQVAQNSLPLTSQTSFSLYVNSLHKRAALREERDTLEKRAEQMDQVVTLAAVNQSASLVINPNLVTGMIEEAAKLRKSMEETVNIVTFLIFLNLQIKNRKY